MGETKIITPSSWLVVLSGPALEPLELSPDAAAELQGLIIGRHEQCELLLPPSAETVSRTHARFTFTNGHWRLTDLKSRWGTSVNGCALAPNQEVPLSEGDMIRIAPWTFSLAASRGVAGGVESVNDTESMQTLVRTVKQEQAAPLAGDLLALLLECAAGIHGATDEATLAAILLDGAARGTGFPNAAFLRPLDGTGRIEVIAARPAAAGTSNGPAFSRSLIAIAATGVVAEFAVGAGSKDDVAQSIVQMKLTAALCVPLVLGSTVAAYLYLDSRGEGGARLGPSRLASAGQFCLALGRIAGLALANLKRMEMERRQSQIMAELSSAAEAQRWILPRRAGTFDHFSYIGESRPGRYVGGDFFDVIPLGPARLAVAMGDVTGKGIPASVLMTATQGFLHAAIREHGDPARAMNDLNRFICPRRPDNKFVTLWLGVFDADKRTLRFVDAGHGYGLLAHDDGACIALAGEDGLPLGVAADVPYTAQSIELPRGVRAMIVSDGIIEQYGMITDAAGQPGRKQFDVAGLRRCVTGCTPEDDAVAALFGAVIKHAGTDALADDATAVCIRA